MKVLGGIVFLFMAGWPILSFSEDIVGEARNDEGTVVTLLSTPCTSQTVLGHLKSEVHEHFKATRAIYMGEPHEACWAEPQQDVVFLMWDDGGFFVAPKEFFKAPI